MFSTTVHEHEQGEHVHKTHRAKSVVYQTMVHYPIRPAAVTALAVNPFGLAVLAPHACIPAGRLTRVQISNFGGDVDQLVT